MNSYSKKGLVERTRRLDIKNIKNCIDIVKEKDIHIAETYIETGWSSFGNPEETLNYQIFYIEVSKKSCHIHKIDNNTGNKTFLGSLEYCTNYYDKSKASKNFFLCPICKKKVESIYVVGGKTKLTCRNCANLTYRSQAKHDKGFTKWKKQGNPNNYELYLMLKYEAASRKIIRMLLDLWIPDSEKDKREKEKVEAEVNAIISRHDETQAQLKNYYHIF